MSEPSEIPFQEVLDALLNVDETLHPRFIYRLSDLEESDLETLKQVWSKVEIWRRQALLEDIEEINANDTLLSFLNLCRFATTDDDAKVRLHAVRTLWEYEDAGLIPLFIKLVERDNDAGVRAAAASALGEFVYSGELEKIPPKTLETIEETLLKVVQSTDEPFVRRAALESLGYSSREEVTPLVETAFASKDKKWVASALFAMGRSANLAWQPQVMEKLESSLPLVRSEAARAAGELEISEATPVLLELLDDPDENTRLASIWSLSQIGGEGVQEALERMYEEAEDEQEIEALETALENLAFNEGASLIPLFDFPEADEEGDSDNDLDFLDEED
jgi:HEAT repeat protein